MAELRKEVGEKEREREVELLRRGMAEQHAVCEAQHTTITQLRRHLDECLGERAVAQSQSAALERELAQMQSEQRRLAGVHQGMAEQLEATEMEMQHAETMFAQTLLAEAIQADAAGEENLSGIENDLLRVERENTELRKVVEQVCCACVGG